MFVDKHTEAIEYIKIPIKSQYIPIKLKHLSVTFILSCINNFVDPAKYKWIF